MSCSTTNMQGFRPRVTTRQEGTTTKVIVLTFISDTKEYFVIFVVVIVTVTSGRYAVST